MLEPKILNNLRHKCDVARAAYTSTNKKQVLVDARVLDELLQHYENQPKQSAPKSVSDYVSKNVPPT